jgi:hypothetical protein
MERVSRRQVEASPPFAAPNRMTPAVSRARSRRRMYGGGAVPSKLEIVACPTCWRSVSPST